MIRLAGLGQFQRLARRRQLAPGDLAEVALGEGLDLVGGDVADHYQGGVVRRVPGFVPVAQVVDGHALQVGHPADGRGVVAAGRVGGGLEALEGEGVGIVVGAQAALLLDHLDLALELVGRQAQVGHAVGFHLQRHRQAVAGQDLVIGGVVVGGEGVLFRTQVAQHPRGFARAELAAALEHHVFEGVGQAGEPGCLVAGADPVPELGNHHRGAVVFTHYDLQAVVEAELVGGLGFRRLGEKRETKAG